MSKFFFVLVIFFIVFAGCFAPDSDENKYRSESPRDILKDIQDAAARRKHRFGKFKKKKKIFFPKI
jgi:hypothetical protein